MDVQEDQVQAKTAAPEKLKEKEEKETNIYIYKELMEKARNICKP